MLSCSKSWFTHGKQESGTPVSKDKYWGWWNRCFSNKVSLSAERSTMNYAPVYMYMCVCLCAWKGNILCLPGKSVFTARATAGGILPAGQECWGTPTRFWFQMTSSCFHSIWGTSVRKKSWLQLDDRQSHPPPHTVTVITFGNGNPVFTHHTNTSQCLVLRLITVTKHTYVSLLVSALPHVVTYGCLLLL